MVVTVMAVAMGDDSDGDGGDVSVGGRLTAMQ
jgi:hypothetical protein